MNNVMEQENLVREFKEEVVKKLPVWIKANEEEKQDVLEELESHIWDKAEELAAGATISTIHVREAIFLMGSPRDIAKEYRRRGKPKLYITEELFDWYYKSLIIIGSLILFANLMAMAFSFGGDQTAGQVVGSFFADVALGFLIGFVGVSIMFVQLSMNGFLPEDFKKLAEQEKTVKVKLAKPEVELRKAEKRAERKAKRKGILESQSSYVFSGIFGITIGFFMLLYPISTISPEHISPELVQWMRLAGALVLAQGFLRFGQALAGKNMRWHQVLMVLYAATCCLWIPLALQLQYDTAIIVEMFQGLFPLHPADKMHLYIKIGSWIMAVGNIFGAIDEVRKIIQLEVQGFSQKG